MEIRRAIFLTIYSSLLLALVSCANIVRPTGGEKDTEGPELRRAKPAHRTLNFSGKQVEFEFNEFLKPGGYSEEVFISPIMSTPPDVLVSGKQLILRFREELDSNTTYVVTIGTGIKDYTEGNPMQQPMVYAFSTGAKLDSVTFEGNVIDEMGTVDLKGMVMLLFHADSIIDNDIKGHRPAYATMVEAGGNFLFRFLKPGRYKIYGVKDLDKSYTWSQVKEAVAMPRDPLIDADSSTSIAGISLSAFLQDEEAPRVKTAKWIDRASILVEFKEPLRRSFLGDSLRIGMGDTLGGMETAVIHWDFVKTSTSSIMLYATRPQDSASRIYFHSLMDTLGNKTDTFEVITPASRIKGADKRFFSDPVTIAPERVILLQSQHPIATAATDSMAYLQDTSGRHIKARLESRAYSLKLQFQEWPDPKMPYELVVKGGFQFADTLTDTTLRWKITIPKQEEFGSLSGSIVLSKTDSVLGGRWILQLYQEASKGSVLVRRTTGDLKFKFDFLPPAIYTIKLIKDLDENGYFTPGSLAKDRLPEKVVTLNDRIEVKAKWDIEDFEASTAPNRESKGAATKGTK